MKLPLIIIAAVGFCSGNALADVSYNYNCPANGTTTVESTASTGPGETGTYAVTANQCAGQDKNTMGNMKLTPGVRPSSKRPPVKPDTPLTAPQGSD